MDKQELIKQIQWIIDGLHVGDTIFQILQDIEKLIKEQKQ